MQAVLSEDPLVASAALFTARRYALAGHFREYSGEAFITHPREVAFVVSKYASSREMLASCWLHYTLADHYTSYEEILALFGEEAANIARTLASLNLPRDYEHSAFKTLKADALSCAPPACQTIALADLYVRLNNALHHAPALCEAFRDAAFEHLYCYGRAAPELQRKTHTLLEAYCEV